MLSVRIVCTNHYMSSPVAGLDVQYSEFRGTEVKQVPVIQIFGATISGEKTCLHVHGVFPYIYIPYEGSGSHARLMYQIASSLDKALNISFGNASSSTQHVYKVMLVSGRPFYGFHVKNHQYFKIYFYNPLVVKRAVELLQNGAILNKIYQPHEAHIPYILQFMIDYNLYGMSYIKVGHVMYRRESQHTEALTNILEEHILPEKINRVSTCELEADCVAADIINRTAITDEIAVNPGLAAIWEDEKQRRREEARSSQITPQSSQQRPERASTTSEGYYMEKLLSKLTAIELQDISDSDLSLKISPEEERMPYPAETPEDCDLTEASYLDLHVHGSNSSSILTGRLVAREIERTLVVDEDVVLSLSASYREVTTPSDTSILLNSQDMQLVQILEDMENGVEDDSILGSQQNVLGNQSTENAEDEGNFLDLSQPLEQLCNTEDITTADSPLPDVESEQEVWDNTFWNEMEGNIPQLDGADDAPNKARRKRLGARGRVKQGCVIKGVNNGNVNVNINTTLNHIEEGVLNDKAPMIESSDFRSSNQTIKNGQLQEAVLNRKSPLVPYFSLSVDTCTPEVIVIESDDENFQNKVEMKHNDPILEEIPPDSDGLSAELFTDDFESFPLQENGDQENNFQNETSSSYSQELGNDASVEDYTESDGTNRFYIASDTSMPFKNVLIGDPSFTAQPCSSDGDELIAEDSIANVSWTGSNVSKSWVTSDKSLEVDIGSPLLAPYDSGGVQEISPEKVPLDNSKIVEQPNPRAAAARRSRRRGSSLSKCPKSAQTRKTTANPRPRRSTRKTSVPVDSCNDPNTSDLNLFSTNTASTISDLTLIVDNTTDMLASTVLLPSCSIGSPSDEVKRIETLLRQGDIEEIMETSCDSADETLHRLKCNHSAHREDQGKEIIEIVIDDSNISENDTNKHSEPKNLEEQRKLNQLSVAEIENVHNDLIICEEVMQDILDTVVILALDIDHDSYTFKDCIKRCRTGVEAEDACVSDAAKKTKIKKLAKKSLSLRSIAVNRHDKNNECRNEVISQSLAPSPRNDEGCKDDYIKNNNLFVAQHINENVGKKQSVVIENNQDSSSQLQEATLNTISNNQIAANKNVELKSQILAQYTAPSKNHSIKYLTNKLESELLAQEIAKINSDDVVNENSTSLLQAQLLSLQTASLSPRKLRSSSSSETYSRKLARKREKKKKDKPNKLSLSSKKKTSVTDDVNTSVNEYVTNGLQQHIVESPIVLLNKQSIDFGTSKDHKLKSDRRASVGELDIENNYEYCNRNLRDSTKKASAISARRSIRKLMDMEHLKNDTVDKNQENSKTDLNQNQKLDTNSTQKRSTHLGSNNTDADAASRVKRKSASTRDRAKRNQKTNLTVDKHLNIAEDDKQFGSSMIDSIVSCKEHIVDIDNISVTGNTSVSTYLPSQHDELLNPKASALETEIESEPLKSKQFRKRLKKQLFSDPVSETDVEMHSIDKGINLALKEVPISSSNKQNNGSFKKHKIQKPKLPIKVSQQVCNKVLPPVLEANVIQPCFIKLKKLEESVIQKFCHNKKNHSHKKKIKKTITVESNGCEQNVTSIGNGKSSNKTAASLQKSAAELNKTSQQKVKAINEKEVNEQKQVRRNSKIGAELIPHSAGQPKPKKRKLSENNNIQIHRVAYETKEFGTVKVPRETLAALKTVQLSIVRLKEPLPGAKNQFNIKGIPILDGSADTSSSDDSVESGTKTPKKHTLTSQALSILRLSKQKKQENSNKANKVAKGKDSKEKKSRSSATSKKARPKAVNVSQSSRKSAYNPLDIIIKRSPKKNVKRTEKHKRRSSATSVIDSKSVKSVPGHEGISDVGAIRVINTKDKQKSAASLDEDISQSDNLSDSRTMDQSSLRSTTTTSLKFINPLAAKEDIEHWTGNLQLIPRNHTTSSISNTSSNVDNNSVNQSASIFQKKRELEVCDTVKECSRFSADTSRSSVFVNMDSASTSYSQNFTTRLDNNLCDKKSARKRLQFTKPIQFSNKTITVPETENRNTNSSGNSIPVHCSSDTKVNVQEVADKLSSDSKIFKKFSHCPDKDKPKDQPQAEENDGHKDIPNDTIIKHSAQPHQAFEYLEKMEDEVSDDDQDHGILSFYEVGLKSPDNINDTILSTDSDNDSQNNSGKSEKGKCEDGLKGPDNINDAMVASTDSDSESSSDVSVTKYEETVNIHNSAEQVKIYTPLYKAPTKESILLTLSELGIPEYVGQEPFVSDPNDATKKKHIGNRTLQLCSNSVAELQDFTGSNQNQRGIEFWRNKLFHGFGPMSQVSADQDNADLNLKSSLASQRKAIITPSLVPPSVKEVELWLKAKELLQQKTDVEKLESEGKREKKAKTKVIMPMSPGQESLSDNEDVLSVISCSPLTPKEIVFERSTSHTYHSTPQQLSGKLPSPHCTPILKTVKHSHLLLKGAISASRNSSLKSSQGTEGSCNSPSLSTIVEEDEEHRPDACLDSTLKLETPCAGKEDRLPILESCCEEQSASKIIQQSQYRKLLTTPKHLKQNSGCQIEGSTPNNSHGFKMSLENLQDARAVSEHQYLTILAMELHIQTRGDLRPDPTVDPIRALFYFVANDVPEDFSLPKENKGLIVVSDKNSHTDVLKQTASCHNVCYVPDEKNLFSELVKLIRKWDPDILVGYEVEMLSWGYLFQRAFTLQINLSPQVSRVPGGKSNNQNPDSNNSQSLDFSHDIRLPGRMVLNVWRLMRHEIALQSYTFESVMYHVLHQRIPLHSFKQLTLWWDHRTHLYRWICVDYYMLRVEGMYRILQQLDLIERTSELARLFGIQFYEVLSRGSQFRVESMMLRLAKPLNYVPVSPSVRQRSEMRAPEALPLIMEPLSGFYSDPLIVLDFQSLYPSIIIAYNYCFSTCLGRVEQLGQNEAFKFGCTHLKVSPAHLLKLKNDLNFSPAGVAFVKERIRKGILPRMLQEILDTRLMVKKSMKEHKEDKILQRVLHSRQLGLKLIANVTYGYTAANFSGRMPCIEVGDSVVSKGRETLHRAISLVKNTAKWNAEVVYGDTDSLFVLVPGRTREQAFKIGAEIAEAVTMDNPKPVKLKLEKVYQPCILQTKKRYVGYMYETPDQEKPVYEAKGIETVRRDGCPAVAKIMEKSLKILFDTRDVSLVKKYVCRQFDKLIQGRINTQDLIFAKEYRGMKGYQPGVCIPALELTRRWLQTDKRAEPRVSERVPYVITAGPPGLPLIQLVRSPHELLQDPSLRVNVTYYITRALIPPLQRCFSLLGADVDSWYASMPRKALTYLPAVVPEGLKKSTISHYFATTNCAVCDRQTHSGICSTCEDDPQSLAVTLEDKLRQWERAYFNITKVCQSCCGRNESVECSSLDCPVLFRRNRALRDLDQGPFVRGILQQYLSF